MHVLPVSRSKLFAALSAGLALCASAPSAMAAVVMYSGPPIAVPNNIDGLYINVVTGVASGFAPSGWDFNVYNNSAGLTFFARSADTSSAYVGVANAASALTVGSVIGPGSSFTANNPLGGGVAGTAFQTPGERVVGFRFTAEASGTVHYGYALLSSGPGTGADAGFPASIITYAFESTPNTAITAVPEPGTYAMLLAGLGLVGTLATRRRAADRAR
jgi:hypothetical protein